MPQTQVARPKGKPDPEASAITKIGKLVTELDEQGRKRVVSYIHDRYCVNTPAQSNQG